MNDLINVIKKILKEELGSNNNKEILKIETNKETGEIICTKIDSNKVAFRIAGEIAANIKKNNN